MVKNEIITKRTATLAVLLLLLVPAAWGQDYEWEMVQMDGSRTGVTIPDATNVVQAMGESNGRVYKAPNGRVFRRGATPKVAKLMIDAQPSMAHVKEVVGFAPRAMERRGAECEIFDWAADIIKDAVGEHTGKKVDIGLINRGGIRVDMPQGNILLDDIMSMFPFRNRICYVALKGSDVRVLFERMAAARRPQCISGMQLTISDRQLEDITIGGEPLDDERIYGVGTIDFLLNGGDDIFVARNAQELIIADPLVFDVVIAAVRKATAEGRSIEKQIDGRIVILK